jgi:hypothetical protein
LQAITDSGVRVVVVVVVVAVAVVAMVGGLTRLRQIPVPWKIHP